MRILRDARDWYESARTNLSRMNRLGTHHWNDPTLLGSSIWDDERFKQVEAVDIELETIRAIKPLEDLGILVMFAVFEANVRDHLERVIAPLVEKIDHPILLEAAGQALEGIQQGSFANKVLAPLQMQNRITPELSDKVKQVRDYRNWIAHGRREPKPSAIINLTVNEAYNRLKDFLDTLGIAGEPELEIGLSPASDFGAGSC